MTPSAEKFEIEYVGFWARVWASVIDSLMISLIMFPALIAIYGWVYFDSEKIIQGPLDFLISWIFPAIAVVGFWIYKSATPGKMVISAKIVDARTGKNPSRAQLIGRYFGYFVSMAPLMLGIIWVAFDKRKQDGTISLRGQWLCG